MKTAGALTGLVVALVVNAGLVAFIWWILFKTEALVTPPTLVGSVIGGVILGIVTAALVFAREKFGR